MKTVAYENERFKIYRSGTLTGGFVYYVYSKEIDKIYPIRIADLGSAKGFMELLDNIKLKGD